MAGDAAIDEHSPAFTCLWCNNMGAKPHQPGKADNEEQLRKRTEEIRTGFVEQVAFKMSLGRVVGV